MIFNDIRRSDKNQEFEKKYQKAIDFLKTVDTSSLEVGKYQLEDGMFYLVQDYMTRYVAPANYEMHKKYADIQYIVSGEEIILGTSQELEPVGEFSEENDIGFYQDGRADTVANLSAGKFALYMPGEYHKPSLHPDGKTPTHVVKIVVKIPE